MYTLAVFTTFLAAAVAQTFTELSPAQVSHQIDAFDTNTDRIAELRYREQVGDIGRNTPHRDLSPRRSPLPTTGRHIPEPIDRAFLPGRLCVASPRSDSCAEPSLQQQCSGEPKLTCSRSSPKRLGSQACPQICKQHTGLLSRPR